MTDATPGSLPPDTAAVLPEPRWVDLGLADVHRILEIENSLYTHPWTKGHFVDSIHAGYWCAGLERDRELLAYMVVMQGVDEAHLLNISVRADCQGQGLGGLLLHLLMNWSRDRGCEWVWLEVRASNTQALAVYRHLGFAQVGRRPNYYPAWQMLNGQKIACREDALVMSYRLQA